MAINLPKNIQFQVKVHSCTYVCVYFIESEEDQWPDITSSEEVVWDTPSPSGHTQKESVASRIKPDTENKEHQLQEQSRQQAAATALEEMRQKDEPRRLAETQERKRMEGEER